MTTERAEGAQPLPYLKQSFRPFRIRPPSPARRLPAKDASRIRSQCKRRDGRSSWDERSAVATGIAVSMVAAWDNVSGASIPVRRCQRVQGGRDALGPFGPSMEPISGIRRPIGLRICPRSADRTPTQA